VASTQKSQPQVGGRGDKGTTAQHALDGLSHFTSLAGGKKTGKGMNSKTIPRDNSTDHTVVSARLPKKNDPEIRIKKSIQSRDKVGGVYWSERATNSRKLVTPYP